MRVLAPARPAAARAERAGVVAAERQEVDEQRAERRHGRLRLALVVAAPAEQLRVRVERAGVFEAEGGLVGLPHARGHGRLAVGVQPEAVQAV